MGGDQSGQRFQPYQGALGAQGGGGGSLSPQIQGQSDPLGQQLSQALGIARGSTNLLSAGNRFLDSSALGYFTGGAGAGLSAAQTGLDFSQGRYLPATANLFRTAGQGAQFANQIDPTLAGGGLGSAGGALGGLAGLAGIGYDLSQGRYGSLVNLPNSLAPVASYAGSALAPSGVAATSAEFGGALGAGSTEGASALSSLAPLLSTAGPIIGGVGAVAGLGLGLYSALNALHNAQEDPRQYASAGGTGLGAGVGALVGSAAGPYGALVGAGAGAGLGTTIGNIIAKNLPKTHYMAQQSHWGEVATDAVNNYQFGIQKAASNGGIGGIQAALSQGQADNHVKAYYTIPDGIASAIGIRPTSEFSDMKPDQFLNLVKAYRDFGDDASQWVKSQGDVGRLEQGTAVQVQKATGDIARTTLKTIGDQLGPYLDQLPPVAPDLLAQTWAQRWTETGPPPELAQYAQQHPGYAAVLQQASVLGPQLVQQRAEQEATRMRGLNNQYAMLYGSQDLQPQTPEAWNLYQQIHGTPWAAQAA